MNLTAAMNTANLENTLQGWEKTQLPFATAKALTLTGQKVKAGIRSAIQRSFDRPTPYTLNSVYLKPATKNNLVAEVELKNWASKGAPPSVYLAPQVFGGSRQPKNSEKIMRRAGVLPSGMFWVPGLGASTDRYGNISTGQIVQVISALKAFPETGYLANRSNRMGARANKNAGNIFVGRPAGGHLPLGVYLRTKDGLKPIMIFINSPHYQKLLPFYETSREIYAANFQTIFNDALRDALILSPFLRAA
jgi:hypothetical protein